MEGPTIITGYPIELLTTFYRSAEEASNFLTGSSPHTKNFGVGVKALLRFF